MYDELSDVQVQLSTEKKTHKSFQPIVQSSEWDDSPAGTPPPLKQPINEEQIQRITAKVRPTLLNIANAHENAHSTLDLIFSCIFKPELSNHDICDLKRHGNFLDVHTIRDIIMHPCPQNRTQSTPGIKFFGDPETMVAFYHRDKLKRRAYEHKGLLDLTPLDDEQTEVTRYAVLLTIYNMMQTIQPGFDAKDDLSYWRASEHEQIIVKHPSHDETYTTTESATCILS